MIDRIIELQGIYNFRDYGGYATANGGRLRTGLLFRSGQHFHATSDDLLSVAALSLRTVVDIAGGIVGGLVGAMAAKRLSARKGLLNTIFAGIIFVVAACMLWQSAAAFGTG